MGRPDAGATTRGPGRSTRPAEDPTALNGPHIDVGSRIGWLARTARLLHGGARLRRLEDMSRATGYPVTRLQRVETGQQRNGDVLRAYEDSLRLPAGSLTAPVDVLCRTFPPQAPRDMGPGEPPTDPAEVSEMTERLLEPALEVTGGEWLAWARAMSQAGGLGLPLSLGRRLTGRLVAELSRSAASGYVSRYEALAQLRSGPYGGLVLDVARGWVADPHVQATSDLTSAIGEAHSPDAVVWLLGLLDDERDRLVVGGAVGLEAMGAVTGDRFWYDLLPHLVQSLDVSAPDSVRHSWTSHLLRLVPKATWAAHDVRPMRRLAPAPAVPDWSRRRTNTLWTACRDRGTAVSTRLGLDSGAMIARLMFDLALSHHETRAVTSFMLLGGLPVVAEQVGVELSTMAEQQGDDLLRSRIARRLPGVLPGVLPDRVRAWAEGPDPALRSAALYAAGSAGVQLPVAVLDAELEGPGFPSGAVYSAGMSDHPVLRDWVSHPRGDVAGAADWWLRQGPRVVR